MAPELASQGREPVAGAARMLDQARDPKLAQPLCEHARGHLRNPRRKLAIGHCVVAKLPDDPHRPAPAQHVEQRKKASVPVSIGAPLRPYLRQCSVLIGSDLAPTSTVAPLTFSQLVRCLDFRCTVRQAGCASDFDAGRRAGDECSVRQDEGETSR